MGTNYTVRIGKRSSLGGERGCVFTWAIPPAVLALLPANADVVQDEYGRDLTVGEFLVTVAGDEAAEDEIGTRFS